MPVLLDKVVRIISSKFSRSQHFTHLATSLLDFILSIYFLKCTASKNNYYFTFIRKLGIITIIISMFYYVHTLTVSEMDYAIFLCI